MPVRTHVHMLLHITGEVLQGVISPLKGRRLVQNFNWQEDTMAHAMICSAKMICSEGQGGGV